MIIFDKTDPATFDYTRHPEIDLEMFIREAGMFVVATSTFSELDAADAVGQLRAKLAEQFRQRMAVASGLVAYSEMSPVTPLPVELLQVKPCGSCGGGKTR